MLRLECGARHLETLESDAPALCAGESEIVDVAVIGAGVSGAFCLNRLRASGVEAVLYEASGRVGGRCLSLRRGRHRRPLEMGALSLSSEHKHALGLCRALSLALVPLDFQEGSYFLRGRPYDPAADEAGAVAYKLAPHERGRHPLELMRCAIETAAPGLGGLWPQNQGRSAEDTAAYLRTLIVADRPLWRWGFWNLLTRSLSHEAYEQAAACFGSAGQLRNINAYDAIWTFLRETHPTQQHFCLRDGFQSLAEALVAPWAASLRLRYALNTIKREKSAWALEFATPLGRRDVRAKRLIVATTPAAMRRFHLSELLPNRRAFDAAMAAILGIDACKLFLTFDTPFWPRRAAAPGAIAITAAFTDQPMRQCYYFEPSEGASEAVVLAVFADDAAASYWSGLNADVDAEAARGTGIAERRPPQTLVDAALAQLSALHPGIKLPPVREAAFADWSHSRAGAAWHAWKPGVKSWEVRERLRQPDPDLPLYLCGEAFAELPGWTEGALNNAEMMLERHFGLPRPDWVETSYPFEISEQCHVERNARISERIG